MDFCEKTVEKVTMELEEQQFWNMIAIHTFNPQLLNRRIVGGSVLKAIQWNLCEYNLKTLLNLIQKPKDLMKIGDKEKLLDFSTIKSSLQTDCQTLNSCIFVIKLLQKNSQKDNHFLIVFLNVPECRVSYFTYQEEEGNLHLKSGYYLTMRSLDSEFELGSYSGDNLEDKDNWLKNMYPKFVKWISSDTPRGRYNIPSLSLIDIEAYSLKYSQLKDKYGENLVRDWPEVTDPQKFVFEDIAIASNLLILWEAERRLTGSSKNQSFIDVGCGNGLLVYILASEGHPGIGIDLRKRKIWDIYPKTVELLEKTINPMEENQIPPTDWIIGNHSDEMSPWIPVLAAKNSPNCRFFLLPCCAYEFNGMKYQRRNCKNSLYHDFIDYTMEISEICGYSVELDRLRIPSTKRICIVGRSRNPLNREMLDRFIEEKSTVKFQAREAIEKVRNCTQIPKSITSQIVEIVFRELLKSDDSDSLDKWNAGVSLELPDVVKKIPEELLKALKDECGGLQTLLRNNHQIFEVIQGQVKIRDPRKVSEKTRKPKKQIKEQSKKFKEKDCWFHLNHPHGCPLADQDCSFRHS